MIKSVFATGFKGRDFVQGLNRMTLILGPNGCGKTARTQALQLAVMGFIPGGAKTNPEILAGFASGDRLVVGFETDKYKFERGFVRAASGTVTQGYRVNGSRVSKEFFAQALGEVGRPKVVDLAAFMALSDQKKLDAIFELFPPGDDPLRVQLEIERARENANALAVKVREAEGAISRMSASRAEVVLPSGNLAEIDAAILENNLIVDGLRKDIEKITEEEIREKAAAAERARAAAEGVTKAEAEALRQPTLVLDVTKSPASQELDKKLEGMEASLKASGLLAGRLAAGEDPASPSMTQVAKELGEKLRTDLEAVGALPPLYEGYLSEAAVVTMLGKILATMDRAGCSSCAARLVIISEMKKTQKGG